MTPTVLVAVEGDTDGPVATHLVRSAGLRVDRIVVMHGHGELDKRAPKWCQLSNRRPMLVLRDLDPLLGADCAPSLVAQLRGAAATSPTTIVRIAERELEAWLLADHTSISSFFSVPKSSIPRRPDDELDPKSALVRLCRSSASSRIRKGMIPSARSGRTVGPEFTGLILEYAASVWNIERARRRSPSLDRAVLAMHKLASELTS
jgi:hypothetical protein